jgi:hypothetical protein
MSVLMKVLVNGKSVTVPLPGDDSVVVITEDGRVGKLIKEVSPGHFVAAQVDEEGNISAKERCHGAQDSTKVERGQ